MTVWPSGSKTRPKITSPYGYSDDYDGFHGGTDFINFDFNCAVAAGTVLHADWSDIGDGGGGIEVRIQHAGFISRTLHNNSALVSEGQTVGEGQRIGVQGTTAYGHFGRVQKHCHSEIWAGPSSAYRTDPVPFIQSRLTSTAGGGAVTTEEDDMTPEQEKALNEIHQALYETKQWMGVIAQLGSVYKNAGDIRQFLTEDKQWTGIIPMLARTDANVTKLVTTGYDPAVLVKTITDAIKASPIEVDEVAIGEIVAPLVSAALTSQFDAIPTAAENAVATRAAIVK